MTWPPNHMVVHQTQEMLLVYTPIYLDHARIIWMQGAALDVTPPSAACDNANEDMWSCVDTGHWSLVSVITSRRSQHWAAPELFVRDANNGAVLVQGTIFPFAAHIYNDSSMAAWSASHGSVLIPLCPDLTSDNIPAQTCSD